MNNDISDSSFLKRQSAPKTHFKTSVIITTFKEPKTIGRAVSAIAPQLGKNDELIVVAPDKETLQAAKKASSKVKIIQDRAKGKSAAMNLAVIKAKGDILVWTDGDIYISKDAIWSLTYFFKQPGIGAAT